MDSAPEKRPTLRSLAEITGLGISTVSQALRNSPEIAEETRKRVQLAAQQAGYRPNRAGVRLRTGKTNVITVVLNPQDEGSGFLSDFVFGISDGLSGTGYHLVVTPYELGDPMGPMRYIAETSSADGVIMSRTQPNDPRCRFLHDLGIPFATHGRTQMDIAHAYHDYDNEAFAHEALRILKKRGRKRVALFGPPRDLTYNIHTNLGFERGLRDFDLVGVPMGSADIDQSLQMTRDLARQLAGQPNLPDGFVSSGITAAVALATGLADGGLEIGKDFDIVSKHATNLLSMTNPKIISIPEDFRKAGFSLAKLLIKAINGEAPETLQELVRPASIT
jgi:LacI family transcriptional regulator